MKILAAPDSFRGSLTAAEVAAAMARGLRAAAEDVEVVELPIADGGEGTVDSAAAGGFALQSVRVRGPLGDEVDGRIAVRDRQAIIELAELCGWPRMPAGRTAPIAAHTLGLGDGIRAALDLGCRDLVVTIGGSVSTDGGSGMLVALGARLFDADGAAIEPGGSLDRLRRIDVSGLDPRLAESRVVLATDVDNPLLGELGAAAVFGPQKGASAQQVDALERSLTRLADVVEGATGIPVRHRAGSGAAGGIAATAVPYLGAEIGSGADLVLDLLGFDKLAADSDLVLTGEGRWDAQTGAAKAPARVAARAWAVGADVAIVAGSIEAPAPALEAIGVRATCALTELEPDVARAMRGAAELVQQASALVLQRWREQ